MMKVKKVKRKCMVRGCKNTDCYAVSHSSEVGNSIIICKECAAEIAPAIAEFEKQNPKQAEKKAASAPPPLFYNTETEVAPQAEKATPDDGQVEQNENMLEEEATVNASDEAVENEDNDLEENEVYVCPKCGKQYKSKRHFAKHLETCEGSKE